MSLAFIVDMRILIAGDHQWRCTQILAELSHPSLDRTLRHPARDRPRLQQRCRHGVRGRGAGRQAPATEPHAITGVERNYFGRQKGDIPNNDKCRDSTEFSG